MTECLHSALNIVAVWILNVLVPQTTTRDLGPGSQRKHVIRNTRVSGYTQKDQRTLRHVCWDTVSSGSAVTTGATPSLTHTAGPDPPSGLKTCQTADSPHPPLSASKREIPCASVYQGLGWCVDGWIGGGGGMP